MAGKNVCHAGCVAALWYFLEHLVKTDSDSIMTVTAAVLHATLRLWRLIIVFQGPTCDEPMVGFSKKACLILWTFIFDCIVNFHEVLWTLCLCSHVYIDESAMHRFMKCQRQLFSYHQKMNVNRQLICNIIKYPELQSVLRLSNVIVCTSLFRPNHAANPAPILVN